MHIIAEGRTDVGCVRNHNEDYVILNPELRLFVVCDGMGGQAAGEVASEMCATIIENAVRDNEALLEAVRAGRTPADALAGLLHDAVVRAGAEVWLTAEENPDKHGMGTTCTAAVLAGRRLIIAHVGDSRAYLVRGGKAVRLTEDHTLVAEMVRRGVLTPDEAARSSRRNLVTRAVGALESVEVDVTEVELAAGDAVVLCSDGLTNYVIDDEIAAEVTAVGVEDGAARLLCEIACDRGGGDNVSVVVVKVVADDAGDEPDAPAKIAWLEKSELFRDLDDAERIRALYAVTVQKAAAGATIVREGDPGDAMYILVDGVCEVEAEDVPVAVMTPGRHFGEMALLSPQPRSATVRTVSEARFLRMGRDDFERLLRVDPHLAAKIYRRIAVALGDRLRMTNRALLESHRELTRALTT